MACALEPLIVPIDYRQESHRCALLELLDLYSREPIGGGVPLTNQVRQRLAEFLENESSSRVWLAFVAGQGVGLAACMVGFSSFAAQPLLNIHDLVVRKDFRSRGIGRALLAQVERYARSVGCCALTLEVRGDNFAAQQLYASCGFIGSRHVEPREQWAFWKKPL